MKIDLCSGWEFVKGRAGRRWLRSAEDSSDSVVHLPHCWNDTDSFQEGVSYYRGPGSYRKQFHASLPGTMGDDWAMFLVSDGFYGTGDVWLNGSKVSSVDGQYLGFRLDVTSLVLPDSCNTVGIRLTNKCGRHVLPGINMPDFLLYGGLSGGVYLCCIPSLHLQRDRTRVISGDASSGNGNIIVEFGVVNVSPKDRACSVEVTLQDSNGNTVASAEPVQVRVPAGGRRDDLSSTLTVSGLATWSPESPCLYTIICRIPGSGAGTDVDEMSYKVGLRDAEFRPDQGFFLNGERTQLVGCNRHESMPGFGRALPVHLHRQDAELIKDMGCNFVRLSHYPEHPAFLDACDELGIMVYAEIATWKSVRGGRWLKAACRQMRDMILRDRNHPSVIIWGMGNESRSRRAYDTLRDVVMEYDPTRPVTYAENHIHRAHRQLTVGVPDVWGINYELDLLEEGRDASRLHSVIVSESSNYPHTVRGRIAEELKQVAMIEDDLSRIEDKPYVSGILFWSFNDYATLRKNRFMRHSGLVDAWRLPKMSAAYLAARYSHRPMLAVYGDLNESGPEVRTFHIFTNCERVVVRSGNGEIVLDDCDVHTVQDIEFSSGELVFDGHGRYGASELRLASFGKAQKIVLSSGELVREVGTRRTFVSLAIEIQDENGHLVRDWHDAVIVEAGDGGEVQSYTGEGSVVVGGGQGRCFVAVDTWVGRALFTASHPYLISGEVAVSVLPLNE